MNTAAIDSTDNNPVAIFVVRHLYWAYYWPTLLPQGLKHIYTYLADKDTRHTSNPKCLNNSQRRSSVYIVYWYPF